MVLISREVKSDYVLLHSHSCFQNQKIHSQDLALPCSLVQQFNGDPYAEINSGVVFLAP